MVNSRSHSSPSLIAAARRIAAEGCPASEADDFVRRAAAAFALSRKPIDRAWYDELSAVSAVAADIAGVGTTHINHLTPRVLDIDELYRRMTERGITMAMTEQFLNVAMEECDRFYPAFQFMLWGNKSPSEAIAAAMVETQGEA